MLASCSFPCPVYLATNPLTLLHSNDLYDAPFLQVHLHLNKQQHLQQLAEQGFLLLLPLLHQDSYPLPK